MHEDFILVLNLVPFFMYLFMLPFLLAFSFSTFVRFVAIVFNVRVSFMRSFSLSFAFIWVLHTTNPFSDCFRVFCFLRARAFVVAVVVRHILFILLLLCAQCSPFTEFTIRFIFDVYMFVILFPFLLCCYIHGFGFRYTLLWLTVFEGLFCDQLNETNVQLLVDILCALCGFGILSLHSMFLSCVCLRVLLRQSTLNLTVAAEGWSSSIDFSMNGTLSCHLLCRILHLSETLCACSIAMWENTLKERSMEINTFTNYNIQTHTHTHTYSLLEIKSAVIACQNVHVQCIYEKQFTGEAFTL